MPKTESNNNYRIVWLVRRLFRALAQKSNESLGRHGITVADRAVMEFLYPEERLSVPEIASRYQVSRQHVQVTVNPLLGSGLLVRKANPRHKRSPLIQLSDRGRSLFAEIRAEDEQAVNQLFSGIPVEDVHTTQNTLETMLGRLGRGA